MSGIEDILYMMKEQQTYAGVQGRRAGSVDVINSTGGRVGTFQVGDRITSITQSGTRCFITAEARGRNGNPVKQVWDLRDGSPRLTGQF